MNRIFIALTIAASFASSAFALENRDSALQLPQGTRFIVQSDIILLANSSTIRIASEDEAKATWCYLHTSVSGRERVLRSGHVFTVENTSQIDSTSLTGPGHAVYFQFSNTTVNGMTCFSGSNFARGRVIPKYGDLVEVLAGRFAIVPSEPETVP